ncbi:MAG: chorismate mutase [archaeon]
MKSASGLKSLRSHIDALDAELIRILTERFGLCNDIAEMKRQAEMPIHDRSREEAILKAVKKSGLERKFAERLFRLILKESKRIQQ